MYCYYYVPSNLYYKRHLSRKWNCWSLRCNWSIACWRCSNYIFIFDLTPGFKGLGRDNYKAKWETFKCWDLVHLIVVVWWYWSCESIMDGWTSKLASSSITIPNLIVALYGRYEDGQPIYSSRQESISQELEMCCSSWQQIAPFPKPSISK